MAGCRKILRAMLRRCSRSPPPQAKISQRLKPETSSIPNSQALTILSVVSLGPQAIIRCRRMTYADVHHSKAQPSLSFESFTRHDRPCTNSAHATSSDGTLVQTIGFQDASEKRSVRRNMELKNERYARLGSS